MRKSNRLKQRLDRLTDHLENENPDLVQAVEHLRELDEVAHRMGLLPEGESYANRISWWPLISVLGTFSAGKSSFINTLLDMPLQKTGNQAVDDRFTVITYSRGSEVQTLPGQALDSDPRFPFYRISEELHDVIPGEGEKIDQYLQMKVVPAENIKGKIVIDSPGFDADDQRASVLEISEHIIGLSDLVLVFFDGRHPEAGAMRDTLEHLIPPAKGTKDADKFLFILNQIDTSAREDNLEEIVAAWRGALSQYGMNSGNFYVHYNEQLAQSFPDERVEQRYRNRRDTDYQAIVKRIDDINVHRTYRIVGKVKPLSDDIENKAVPRLTQALDQWRASVVMYDFLTFSLVALLFGLFVTVAWNTIDRFPLLFVVAVFAAVVALIYSHFSAREYFAEKIEKTLGDESYGSLAGAFKKSTAGWRSVFWRFPSGYSLWTQSKLERIREKTETLMVNLNTKLVNPSGEGERHSQPSPQPSPMQVSQPQQVAEYASEGQSVSKSQYTSETRDTSETLATRRVRPEELTDQNTRASANTNTKTAAVPTALPDARHRQTPTSAPATTSTIKRTETSPPLSERRPAPDRSTAPTATERTSTTTRTTQTTRRVEQPPTSSRGQAPTVAQGSERPMPTTQTSKPGEKTELPLTKPTGQTNGKPTTNK